LTPIQQKSILITGAGRGIGKRLALGLAQAGCRIGLLARSQAELDLAKLEIEQAGGSAMRLRADVRNPEEIGIAVERMRAQYGTVDGLICAAAVMGPIGPFLTTKPKLWSDAVEVNLLGVANSCRAALPLMIERRSGKVIALSGAGSAYSRPNFTAYAAAKAAMVRFIECLADEVRDHNIQVNAMAPGAVYTHMTDEILSAGEERAGRKEVEAAEEIRVTGGVPPEKQIQLAQFLLSERSNHISGKLIHVNDDWKRLESENTRPELFTLRRVHRM
jgi:NAD(P)-dependent dehydrogenase (short-subunit alcohol dehydrogenase family)